MRNATRKVPYGKIYSGDMRNDKEEGCMGNMRRAIPIMSHPESTIGHVCD